MIGDDEPDAPRKERDGGPIAATLISAGLRELEARHDHGSIEEGGDGPLEIALTYDEDGNPLVGKPIPWRLPRPPDAPPPRKPRGMRPDYERRAYVEQLWRAMYATSEIIEIVTIRFRCEAGVVRKDIARTKAIYLKDETDAQTIALRKAQMRAQLMDLVREARAGGDRSTARYCLDKIAKLDGLYAPIKHEHDHTLQVQAIGLQIDTVINALDEAGLAAFEIVMGQLQAAGIALPTSSAQPALAPGDAIDAEYADLGDADGDDDDVDSD